MCISEALDFIASERIAFINLITGASLSESSKSEVFGRFSAKADKS